MSVNAQVLIGSDNDPHEGSILDLSNTGSLGMLLPRVPLGAADVFQLSGEAAVAAGMVVYNTNAAMANGYGAGVYVWDGAKWNIVSTGATEPFVPGDYETTDATYNPLMSGVTCIDVRAGQPNPGTLQYVITETGTGTIANVIWTVTPSTQELLVSNTVSGTSNTTQELVFKSQAELWVLVENVDQNITLVAYIKYSDGKKVQVSKTVNIRNRPCCPGVIIPGGTHSYSGAQYSGIPNGKTYDELISTYNFKREELQDLCIYYRDYTKVGWDNAVNVCATGYDLDYEDRRDTWRLPNIAELAQMSLSGATADWAPKWNALESVAGADPRTTNIRDGEMYWSATEYSSTIAMYYWVVFGEAWRNTQSFYYWVRCVRTMN
jgi:hypothetical protein